MDVLSSLMNYVVTGIKKSKVIKSVKTDFNDAISNDLIALWKKIKPIFIVEDNKLVEKIENNPDDEVAQAGLKYKLSEKLEDTQFKTMVSELIENIKKLETENKPKMVKKNKIANKGDNNTIIQNSHINKK